MGENLVIVESPGKIDKIQKFLGKDYTVKASFGHIRDLKDKSLSINIEKNFEPEYTVPADKRKVISDLKKASSAAATVWLASDEDREGEAIAWHLSETLGLDPAKTRRIVFHEITKDAILESVKHPRGIDMNLVNAQQARRVLDRLVGFELSPVLWRKIQPKLSAGRVQSVALRLVVDREREILAFKNEPYYKVDAVFHPAGAPASTKVKATLDTRFATLPEAEQFLRDSIGARYTVESLKSKEGRRVPAAPFTTSTLQQEAGRKLHFPVAVTMRVAQSLYERGLITYMRTDSTNLSTLAINTAKHFILGNFGESYSRPRQYHTHTKGAQEAHEAIRPTFIENTAIEGTAQEQKLYNLIWKRTVASQMADALLENTTLEVAQDRRPEKYTTQASRILFDGFLKVYMEGSDDVQEGDEVILPELHTGDAMDEKGVTAECKFTQAPFRYSEPTLIKKLEELGIGRPSTYAPTITTLTTGRGYVTKGDKEGRKEEVTNLALKNGVITSARKVETVGAEKGKLIPQDIGLIVTDYLVANFPEILNYDFTANVEKDFDQIADGEKVWNDVIAAFYAPFHQRVDETLSDRQYSRVSREIGTAPDGDVLVAKFGQFGPYVQKGDPAKRLFASLQKGQLIESLTLEEALKLFTLPRTVGTYEGVDVVVLKGRFGPYLKYGDKNISLPKGADPVSIRLEDCIPLITAAASAAASEPIASFRNGEILVLNGRSGPYIKSGGSNYKIPSGKKPETLTEADCLAIINNPKPQKKPLRRK